MQLSLGKFLNLKLTFMQTPYSNAKKMVTDYSRSMKEIAAALQNNPGGPQLNIKSPIGFYLEKAELAAALKTLDSTQCDKYVALFGIDDVTGNFTVCLVGADTKDDIHPAYKNDNNLHVEEKWPKVTALTLASAPDELEDFLNTIK